MGVRGGWLDVDLIVSVPGIRLYQFLSSLIHFATFLERVANSACALPFDVQNLMWICLYQFSVPLRKHAYSNILKILQPRKGKFSVKKF